MSQWNSTFRALLATAAVAAAQPAAAVDAVASPLPAAVGDNQVTIGERSLKLPPGQWTLVSRSEGQLKNGTQLAQTYHTVYAIDAQVNSVGSQSRALRTGVLVRLPVNRASVDTSNEEPCRHPDGSYADLVHRQDFEPGRHCLLVFAHRSHMQARDSDVVTGKAAEWANAVGMARPGAVYEISYARFASDDFGWVRVVVPVSAFANQADAIAWAQKLPPALGEMLANRTTQAVLPALNGSQ